MSLNILRGVLIAAILGPILLNFWIWTLLLIAALVASFVLPDKVAPWLSGSKHVEIVDKPRPIDLVRR